MNRPAMSHAYGLRSMFMRKELIERGSVLMFADARDDNLARSMVTRMAGSRRLSISVSGCRIDAATVLVYDISRVREARERIAALLAA